MGSAWVSDTGGVDASCVMRFVSNYEDFISGFGRGFGAVQQTASNKYYVHALRGGDENNPELVLAQLACHSL